MSLRFGSRELTDVSPAYAVRSPLVLQSAYEPDEFCEVLINGEWRRFRVGDQRSLLEHPGLYEQLMNQLECTTPQRAAAIFGEVLFDWFGSPSELRVLELGAGNGLMAAELRQLGAGAVMGIDHRPEASAAARRDRPWAYDYYLLGKLTARKASLRRNVAKFSPNCLVMLAGDADELIDASAFAAAWDVLPCNAWAIFSMSDTAPTDGRQAKFQQVLRELTEQGCIQMECYRRYVHRITMGGVPVCHVLFVARKLQPMSASM
jgi:SAM-dependent methyltransferase